MTTHRAVRFITAGLAGLGLLAATAQAEVSINIKLPTPPLPVISLPAPPHMVWLPGPSVYVAVDTPHNIFFENNRYYLFDHDMWYVGPGYGGPWGRIEHRHLPPGLHKYRHEHWGEYQREAGRRYRDGGDRDHRNFVGWKEQKREEKAERKRYKEDSRDHDHDHGHGNGKGKGRGKD